MCRISFHPVLFFRPTGAPSHQEGISVWSISTICLLFGQNYIRFPTSFAISWINFSGLLLSHRFNSQRWKLLCFCVYLSPRHKCCTGIQSKGKICVWNLRHHCQRWMTIFPCVCCSGCWNCCSDWNQRFAIADTRSGASAFYQRVDRWLLVNQSLTGVHGPKILHHILVNLFGLLTSMVCDCGIHQIGLTGRNYKKSLSLVYGAKWQINVLISDRQLHSGWQKIEIVSWSKQAQARRKRKTGSNRLSNRLSRLSFFLWQLGWCGSTCHLSSAGFVTWFSWVTDWICCFKLKLHSDHLSSKTPRVCVISLLWWDAVCVCVCTLANVERHYFKQWGKFDINE